MKFSTSFCDPLEPEIIALGDTPQDAIIDQFEKIDWNDYLQKVRNAKQDDIYYHPSFEVENKESKTNLIISVVGEPSNYEFYMVLKRPKKAKTFFGLIEQVAENYSTKIEGQTRKDALDCLKALLRSDTEYLSAIFRL